MKNTTHHFLMIILTLLIFSTACNQSPEKNLNTTRGLSERVPRIGDNNSVSNGDTAVSISRLDDDSVVTLTLLRLGSGNVKILNRTVTYNSSPAIKKESHILEEDIESTEELNNEYKLTTETSDSYWLIPHDGTPSIDITQHVQVGGGGVILTCHCCPPPPPAVVTEECHLNSWQYQLKGGGTVAVYECLAGFCTSLCGMNAKGTMGPITSGKTFVVIKGNSIE